MTLFFMDYCDSYNPVGLPCRFDRAAAYRGPATAVYGHTPVPEHEWLNRTINIDTACLFGGKRNALRYPEYETVSIDSEKALERFARE